MGCKIPQFPNLFAYHRQKAIFISLVLGMSVLLELTKLGTSAVALATQNWVIGAKIQLLAVFTNTKPPLNPIPCAAIP